MMTELPNGPCSNNEGMRPTNENFEHGSVGLKSQSIKAVATDLGILLLSSISMLRDPRDPVHPGNQPLSPSLWRR